MAKLTFMGFARDTYLPTLAPTTHDTVRREVEELVETFGRYTLADIGAEEVERWWSTIRSAEKPRVARTDNGPDPTPAHDGGRDPMGHSNLIPRCSVRRCATRRASAIRSMW